MRYLLVVFLLLTSFCWATPVTTFSGGTENSTTDRFVVDGPWKLSWDFQGTALKVFIHTDGSSINAKPISQAGAGKGSMTIERGGTFWLEVKSVGEYKLTVEQQAKGASTLPVFEGGLERKGTSVFTAPEGWRFRYQSTGVLKATLYDAKQNQVGQPAILIGGGQAEMKVGKAGQYFFMIQSSGTYKIEVLAP